MNPTSLTEATIQDIQLELIRRRKFNEFDGPKVVESLRRHRNLWQSVFMSMEQFVADGQEMPWLSLRPLLSMMQNRWQADTMFALCPTLADAEELREVAIAEDWRFDEDAIVSGKTLSDAIGITPFHAFVLRLWWD